jgi:hypothetical protein
MILLVISFVIAVALGAWRQSCIVYEAQNAAMLGPRAWYITGVRQITWLITTIFSIVFAFIVATWIGNNIGEFIGKFSFGVLLVFRWFISMAFGAWPAINHLEKVMNSTADD